MGIICFWNSCEGSAPGGFFSLVLFIGVFQIIYIENIKSFIPCDF